LGEEKTEKCPPEVIDFQALERGGFAMV